MFIGAIIYIRTLSRRYRFFGFGLFLLFLVCGVYDINRRNSPDKSLLTKFQTAALMPAMVQMKTYYTQLDDLPTFSIEQVVSLTPRYQSDSVQISSSSYLTGFVAGFYWSPTNILVDALPDRRVHYQTNGLLEWKLLGLTIYKQPRQFDGWLTH